MILYAFLPIKGDDNPLRSVGYAPVLSQKQTPLLLVVVAFKFRCPRGISSFSPRLGAVSGPLKFDLKILWQYFNRLWSGNSHLHESFYDFITQLPDIGGIFLDEFYLWYDIFFVLDIITLFVDFLATIYIDTPIFWNHLQLKKGILISVFIVKISKVIRILDLSLG